MHRTGAVLRQPVDRKLTPWRLNENTMTLKTDRHVLAMALVLVLASISVMAGPKIYSLSKHDTTVTAANVDRPLGAPNTQTAARSAPATTGHRSLLNDNYHYQTVASSAPRQYCANSTGARGDDSDNQTSKKNYNTLVSKLSGLSGGSGVIRI